VIVSMQRVRILGPGERLVPVLLALQDLGALHLCPSEAAPPVMPVALTPRQERHRATLLRALEDAEEALARLGAPPPTDPLPPLQGHELAREVRFVRRVRGALARIAAERALREVEREKLAYLERILEAFADLERAPGDAATRSLLLVLSGDTEQGVARLEAALTDAVGDVYRLHTRPLAGRDLAVALLVPVPVAERIETLLAEVGVRELELPEAIADHDPLAGLEALRRHHADVDAALEFLDALDGATAQSSAERLHRARAAFNDALIQLEALTRTAATEFSFVVEGWLPEAERPRLDQQLAEAAGPSVLAETLDHEAWSAEQVPVAIRNPRLLRPFELITRWMPLPHYGTIDATPFVAVFFPMFFGLILGDLGYGAVLGALALLVRWRASEGGLARSVAEIAMACAAFSLLFGALFGELFGDLGARWLGLHPLAFAREEALVPFLALAVSVGFVHVLLGLVLGAISVVRSEPRRSLGRGLAALMLVLTAAVLLAAVNLLPDAFFTPAVVGLLVLFPILIAVEGTIAPIELLSRISNILSYARIMALGTASVMLAMVANQFVGTAGSVVVGVLFAALFHLVNFALGVFSPTVHALRLHFVEFFGTFYSPGGQVYRPFRHWSPADTPEPSTA
jgi:V/A-type H+-transporting ATPase subunit I